MKVIHTLLFFYMFNVLWQFAIKRPIVSGLIGILVSTVSATSIPATGQMAYFDPPHYILAQTESTAPSPSDTFVPPPSGDSGRMMPPADGGGYTQPPGGLQMPPDGGYQTPPYDPNGGNGGIMPLPGPGGDNPPPPPQGDNGGMMPPQNWQGGQQGWDDQGGKQFDDSQRQQMDEKRQAEEAAREKKELERVKKDVKRSEAGIKQMQKFMDKLVKSGVKPPQECSQAISDIKATIEAINKAQTMEEMQESGMEDMGDKFETLNDCRMTMEMLMRVPKILKQVDSEIKKIEKKWKLAKNRAKDLTDIIAEGDAILASIKEARANIGALVQEGNVEDIEATIEEGVFSKFDDMGNVVQRLEIMKNSKRFMSEYKKKLREAETTIAKLKKMKEDTTELEKTLAQIKEIYTQMQSMKNGTEEFADAMEEIMDLAQEFAGLAGTTEDVDKMFAAPQSKSSMPMLEVPNF